MDKNININAVINYLNRSFSAAASSAAPTIGNKAVRTVDIKSGFIKQTPMYNYQVEFCYLIDNIARCPHYIATKNIQAANELIARMGAEAKT